jgi:hypothetical protein
LGNDEGVTVHEEDAVLSSHVLGCEPNVTRYNLVILDGEPFVLVGAAKRALIMRTAQGDLQQDAVGLAGRPDAIPLVVHAFVVKSEIHDRAVSIGNNIQKPKISDHNSGFFVGSLGPSAENIALSIPKVKAQVRMPPL